MDNLNPMRAQMIDVRWDRDSDVVHLAERPGTPGQETRCGEVIPWGATVDYDPDPDMALTISGKLRVCGNCERTV